MEKETVIFRIILLLVFTVFIKLNYAQNLIKNGSFELFKECPKNKKLNDNLGIKDWIVPNKTTVDYFNICCKNKLAGIPINYIGDQDAKNGDAYVGIWLVAENNYSEYLQTELISSLKKDTNYCVKFYVSLADKSPFYTNDIGLYFTKEKLKGKGYRMNNTDLMSMLEYDTYSMYNKPIYFEPQIKSNQFISDYNVWVEICGYYKAKGGESYITIGSFCKEPRIEKRNNYNNRSEFYKAGGYVYYYIDDVSVVPISSPEDCQCQETKQPEETISLVVEHDYFKDTTPGSRIILNNIYFAFNDSTLLESSFTELNRLVAFLSQSPLLKIKIDGHTDNTGSDEYNEQLSKARARAVVNYLTDKGISTERLSYQGFGASQPLTTNDTEEGRKINRRVEFIILEK